MDLTQIIEKIAFCLWFCWILIFSVQVTDNYYSRRESLYETMSFSVASLFNLGECHLMMYSCGFLLKVDRASGLDNILL